MVDGIASIGCMPFEMDRWGVDVAITCSQKGLMMTPGLSFVAAGAKASVAHTSADLRTAYWDWTARDMPENYRKFCGTPPEHMLFGLRAALDLLFEEGLENAWALHVGLANAAQAAVEVWAEHGALRSTSSIGPQRDAAERAVAIVERPDQLCMLLDDVEGPGFDPIAERHDASHPHAFLLGGGDLVADALARVEASVSLPEPEVPVWVRGGLLLRAASAGKLLAIVMRHCEERIHT